MNVLIPLVISSLTYGVQKRVIIPNLPAILLKACLQVWLLADIWELGFWEGSHHSKLVRVTTMPKLYRLYDLAE